jgi:hypothetical protein
MPGNNMRITPLGAILRGLVAGAVGTAAMDMVWYMRYRRGGGKERFLDWELSTGLTSWDNAPAPALVGKRLLEGFSGKTLPPERAAFVNNVMHWAYGIGWGTVYGVLAGSLARPFVALGVPFGAAVWATDYVVLPKAGVYKPIWEYDRKTLWKDLSAHLAYGTGTAAAFALLTRAASANSRPIPSL